MKEGGLEPGLPQGEQASLGGKQEQVSEAGARGLQEGPGVGVTSRAGEAGGVWSQKAWGSVERGLGFILIAVGIHGSICSLGM